MKNKSEHEHTGNKILGKHIRQFLHKCVTRTFDVLVVQYSVVVVQKKGKGKTKKRAARAIWFFLLIRSIRLDAIFIVVPV